MTLAESARYGPAPFRMIDHLSLGTSDLARASAFYDALLVPLGYARLWSSERGVEYGPPGGEGVLAIFDKGDLARPPGEGWHLAFRASSRAQVDEFHVTALRLGAADEGPPGLRPNYGTGYYAAFVRDPDGHRLEIVCHER